METITKSIVTFNNKHQSDMVVVGSEEAIVGVSPEIAVVPSFTFA